MDFFETIMFPFKWLVSIIMVGFHEGLTAIGLPEASGWTWTLSIIGLVLVIRAAPATPAYRSGLRDGDVVIRVAGDDVSSVREFRNTLAAREHDGEAKLVIVRDGRKQDVMLRW